MVTEKKYILTDEFITIGDKKLYRIKALKDFFTVEKGEMSGFIENEANLSQYGNCWVHNDAMVYDKAKVYDNAMIFGCAQIYGNAEVCGNVYICSNAIVRGNAKVYDNVKVYGNSKIDGNVIVYGYAKIFKNAEILNNSDYIVFKNWWSSGRYFTWTRSNNMWEAGCFYGTGEELIAKAYKESELSGREYERVIKYVESIIADSEK